MSKMKTFVLFIIFLLLIPASGFGQARTRPANPGVTNRRSVKQTLAALETRAWEEWKKRNVKFYQSYLTDNSTFVEASGVLDKKMILAELTDTKCEVRGFTLDNFDVVVLDRDSALLTYRANQDYTCAGTAWPAPLWISSLYLKTNGRWQNAFYQETPAENDK